MKIRTRRLLEILLRSDSFSSVSDIASEMGAGIRTVFRDMRELEFYLKDYGVSIEKKRSVGIRLVGDTSLIPETEKTSKVDARLPGLSAPQRQLATIVYLGQSPRIVKLGELATLFSVSDSCVSTDLKELDAWLAGCAPGAQLARMKGVGVSLEGDEWSVRMAVLHGASGLVNQQDLIKTLLYEKVDARLERMLSIPGFKSRKKDVLDAIHETEKILGYRFSWYDFGLLFLYLLVALERGSASLSLPSRRLAEMSSFVPEGIARMLWANFAADDDKETQWLRGVLAALEPGELKETALAHPEIARIVSALIADIGAAGYFRYDFDARLFTILQVSLSSLVTKKIFGLPTRAKTSSFAMQPDRLQDILLGILRPQLRDSFGLDICEADIEPAFMAIRAADDSLAGVRSKRRVLVACFEGICLAQFIGSIIRTNYPEVTVVSTLACDRVSDEYVRENCIDLVITTFPTGLKNADEYVVNSPFDAASFRREIGELLSRFDFPSPKNISAPDAESAPDSSINSMIGILHRFSLKVLPNPVPEKDITSQLAAEIFPGSGNAKLRARLKADFDAREAYGPVILEQSGIRMFHCRSAAVEEPLAGAVRISPTRETWVYLVAPEPARSDAVKTLSRISVALIEDQPFSAALVGLGLDEIKRRLFAYLAATL
jgi:biotin operon repressor